MRSPIRKSLLRKIAWLGGDRRVVGFFGLMMSVLAWTMLNGFGLLYGLTFILPSVIFLFVLWAAREANNADPWMVDVLLRQFKYRKYYTPKSDLGIEHPQVRDFI